MDRVSPCSEGTSHPAQCRETSQPINTCCSLHRQHGVLKASGQPSQQWPHVLTCALTCQPRAASCPLNQRATLGPATATRSGLRPWEPFALAATYNSAGEDLCHPSSSRGKRRNCWFLVPCEQQGRLKGTQDIFPNISGLIFKKTQKTQHPVPAGCTGNFTVGIVARLHRTGDVCVRALLLCIGHKLYIMYEQFDYKSFK